MARKIIGFLVASFLIVAAFVGHRLNDARRGVSAVLSGIPAEPLPLVLENLEVAVPARFVHLTPSVAQELDRGEGSDGYASDLAASPLVLVARALPPVDSGWHGLISLSRLPGDTAPEAVTDAWCGTVSIDAAHPLTRAEVRAEAIGPVCRSEHTSPSEPHALMVYAALVLPGPDWVMVCHLDDRSPEDLAACDEAIRAVRPHG
jgi:hypothetical protein